MYGLVPLKCFRVPTRPGAETRETRCSTGALAPDSPRCRSHAEAREPYLTGVRGTRCTVGIPSQSNQVLRFPQQCCSKLRSVLGPLPAVTKLRRDVTRVTASVEGAEAVSALPSPPAGFILNEYGEVVLMAPENKRLLTIVDPETSRSLDCVIRRTFFSESGLQFFLLYPLDTPVLVYQVNRDTGGLIEIDDDELTDLFPSASYALVRRNFHLVLSGFVLTVRGSVCFSQDDITSMNTEYGMGIGSSLSEGVDIASFTFRGRQYTVYTPFDPLLFVAYRDPASNAVRVAEDEELLSDLRVVEALEEEQDFQRIVNEEEEMAEYMKSA